MQRILATGFNSEELHTIGVVTANKGYGFTEVEGDIIERIADFKNNDILFFGIHKKEDIRLLKRIMADSPELFYVCGVDYSERGLVYAAGFLRGVSVVFFLPPISEEIEKILAGIKEAVRLKKAEFTVSMGLKDAKQKFEWQTGELEISGTCKYLADLLYRAGFYRDTTERDNAALALEEALINSVEHGNLELDSSLRPKNILEDDKYESLKEKRLKIDKYADRKIKIRVEINTKLASVSIEDEGPGFDTTGVKGFSLETDPDKEEIVDVSGKGFSLIKRAFDRIGYKNNGRLIRLTKFKQ